MLGTWITALDNLMEWKVRKLNTVKVDYCHGLIPFSFQHDLTAVASRPFKSPKEASPDVKQKEAKITWRISQAMPPANFLLAVSDASNQLLEIYLKSGLILTLTTTMAWHSQLLQRYSRSFDLPANVAPTVADIYGDTSHLGLQAVQYGCRYVGFCRKDMP